MGENKTLEEFFRELDTELQKRFKGSDAELFSPERSSAERHRLEAEFNSFVNKQRKTLLQIADLANVPEENRSTFCELIADQLLEIRWDCLYQAKIGFSPKYYSAAVRPQDRQPLERAERAIRIAKEAIASLTAGHRRLLGMSICAQLGNRGLFDSVPDAAVAVRPSQMARIIFDWPEMLDAIGTALTKSTGKNPYQKPTGKKGRPRGSDSNWHFNLLVRYLCRIADAAGGHLTFDKSKGSAPGARGNTLITALHLLRPLMPPGVIKSNLPLRTIEPQVAWSNKVTARLTKAGISEGRKNTPQ